MVQLLSPLGKMLSEKVLDTLQTNWNMQGDSERYSLGITS